MLLKKLARVGTGCLILALFCMSGDSARLAAPAPVVRQEEPLRQGQGFDTDVLIVGAGISGLAAALEAGQSGARVTVVDLWSVFGGHAVLSGGVVSIVATPYQESKGIKDTPDLAYRDFIDWGEDPNKEWVRYYVSNSKQEIYDWLTPMGVTFVGLGRNPGNSVPRVHRTKGAGLSLVVAIYRECLKYPNIDFIWNHKVVGLIHEKQRIAGVEAQDLRTKAGRRFRAPAVVLATGGFQSNLRMVRDFWPRNLRFPDQLLIGSGINAAGTGHALAQKTGATLSNMDHQWNYSTGIVDPRYPGSGRGLRVTIPGAIWVNLAGERFVNESESYKVTLPAVVNQKTSSYWAVFDETGRKQLGVSGTTGWDNPAEVVLKKYPGLIKVADSVEQLAKTIGVPRAVLAQTVARYNAMVEKGADEDFGRFGAAITASQQKVREAHTPAKIDTPPFYAVQSFPLTRKSMGGVSADLSCRVLDRSGHPIPGLYAVGELTGFGRLNGKAGLEGTFLGPAMLTGRVGGRTVLADLKRQIHEASPGTAESGPRTSGGGATVEDDVCLQCHPLAKLVATPRPGFDHFERAHGIVLERKLPCEKCHSEFVPIRMDSHKIDRLAQTDNCESCH